MTEKRPHADLASKYYSDSKMNCWYWNDTHFDRAWLKRGMVYATKADAEAACALMARKEKP